LTDWREKEPVSRNRTPVVIIRKDKKLKYGLHLLAFALTGGASAPISAVKAASNAGYNARTRELAAQADAGKQPQPPLTAKERRQAAQAIETDEAARWRAEHVPGSKEYRAAH
jgi:hypothetical protein